MKLRRPLVTVLLSAAVGGHVYALIADEITEKNIAAKGTALKSQADLNGPLASLKEAGPAAEPVEEQNLI
jgi:hypothetical protein